MNDKLLAVSMPGFGEWIIILLIVVIIFGASRIPQLGDAIGKGLKNFRKSFKGEEEKNNEDSQTKGKPKKNDEHVH